MKGTNEMMKDVLFQKIGNTWYAFVEVDGEVAFCPLPESVNPHKQKLELYHFIKEEVAKHQAGEHFSPEQVA